MGYPSQWKRDEDVVGIELRFLWAVSLAGGPSALPDEKEIQEGDEKTSTDEQETRALDRLRTFIAYFFYHVCHGGRSLSSVRLTRIIFGPALPSACSSAFA